MVAPNAEDREDGNRGQLHGPVTLLYTSRESCFLPRQRLLSFDHNDYDAHFQAGKKRKRVIEKARELSTQDLIDVIGMRARKAEKKTVNHFAEYVG